MTPRQFLDEIAAPNVEEFLASPTVVRLAWTAVISLHHFEDYFAAAHKLDISAARKVLEHNNWQIELVRHVANAFKHLELGRGKRKGLSIRDARIGQGAAFSDGAYYSDGTSHSDAPDVVRIEHKDKLIDVPHLCKDSLILLRAVPERS